VALAAGGCVVLGACNPLIRDPISQGGEIDTTDALYTGPPAAWLETGVTGAGDDAIFAFALVRDEYLEGPEQRSCAVDDDAVVDCVITPVDVRTPTQRTVAGDGSYTRLMTLWPGERVDVVLVCVDPTTQELGCPAETRVWLRTVDNVGALVGELGVP